ncbi:alpha/beta fold hydrolase [Nocardioides lianchengensis]|uniref:Pimeloyl-ACP methyl ester carboxylesterase n=1 Tax=Nocardioides lianchengensis TaxID=1045774 RepID=A0A1G7AR04_9ACTN|nr:alpha/beta fold hydrolase [Nocardioides lianchengensis]NYG13259.1 pimeloyl-ACP methyl ester carboxylesterase [Nocardioides lianchengensis]SDE17162.1 Pimeloyl-ACP methyl ester carboxylesterase [Nocardioides lianchengensis]
MRTFDGLRLHVAPYGPVEAPVTVVLAHCWTSDAEDWHYQVRDLLARFGPGVRILTWDLRGHGRSDAAPESACTIENLARDLGDLVDVHAPHGRLVVAGHSIGGMTMTALPRVRPDLVERIAGLLFVATSSGRLDTVTLGLPEVGPAVRNRLPVVLATRARLLNRRTRRRSPSIERAVVNRFLFGEPLRLRDAGLVVDQLICCPPATMSGFYRDFMRHERTADLAAYDGIPTRVLVGDRDLLTPPEHARRIAGAIRGARLLVAPGAGHMLPLERDKLVSGQLVELVEEALVPSGR